MDYETALFAAELGEVPEIDLHQMTVNLAIDALESFVDQSFVRGDESIKIIHGRGSGKLRDAIHAWLKKHPNYIAAYRDSHAPGQTGGVTVVALHRVA